MPFKNMFFAKYKQNVINQMQMQTQAQNTQTEPIGQNPIQTSVFVNQDINGFAQIIKQKGAQNPNSLFARANDRDIQILFDHIDTDKNGKIDDKEAKAIANIDGDANSLSDEDFTSLCQKIYDSMCEQDRIASQQAYQNQFGGANYQNYGSRMGNGSYLNTQEQYSVKNKLDDIENKEIPKLKEQKEKIEADNKKYVEEQNKKIDEILQKEDEALGDLDDKYKGKQAEIDECDKKIEENDKKIAENKDSIHKSNSIIANLKSELANLKTDTDNEKINAQNTKRKAEIEKQITAEEEKIKLANEAIQKAEAEKKKQEELKTKKNEELQAIQDEIKKIKPEVAQEIEKIKKGIEEANKKTKADIEKIDKEIEIKRTQAIEYQKDLGERAGKAASMTGSEVVKRALEIAEGEVGVRESGKNNGAVAKYRNGVNNSAPWCASFVSYLYGAGQGSDNRATFGYQPSVEGIRQRAIAAGCYSSKNNYTPQPGDIMIMKEYGASHTAIVKSVGPNGEITTIGGNEGNAVSVRTYTRGSRGYNKISGFVRMNEWQSRVAS